MDSYEVIRPLASGSFGQIFLVTHKHEKRKYVLKKISVLSLDAKERESVEQEVGSLRSVRVPTGGDRSFRLFVLQRCSRWGRILLMFSFFSTIPLETCPFGVCF